MAEQRSSILGATSGVGVAVARQLAEQGTALLLVARDADKLASIANDLQVRGADVQTLQADFSVNTDLPRIVDAVKETDSAWFFYGTLPEQAAVESSWAATEQALQINFLSAAQLLTELANAWQPRGSGSLVVVSSVAGDRGRASNYVYGTAKGALTLFCQGLRNRLQGSGVRVLTVKPGFIDTPMTAEIEKKPAPLWATADKVAADIIKAEAKGRDVIYTPWFWQFIMLIIQHIPEKIFKRLSL